MTGLARRMRTAPVLACVAALSSCGEGLSFTDGLTDYGAEVVGVRSVRIGTDVYVLAGIDTPRPAPHARCWAEALLAREARMALDGLVQNSARIHTQHEHKPASGQLTALVEVNGEDLSEAMVSAGFGVRSDGTRFDWCGPVDPTLRNAPELGYAAAFGPASQARGGAP